ncbi:hypothetical protein [Streptomyces sp. SID3212]|uniref:4'-phosphopantetheinyl transferase family protein n=1 Tax=unclassified Streptomyces TaxID=2593676 RepID=UPI001368FC2E|nr:hypothetical protein [Streptomyces sp. SID3212]MYV55521.1 hypothetical protein [Streptomyces sp. SID3212]
MPLPESTDLWIVPLDTDPALHEARLPELGAYERDRAHRLGLRKPAARRRYLAAHLAARDIVAGYLACEPAELTHVRNAWRGKPGYVLGWCPGPAVSLSRSHELALLAVRAPGAVVGVDLEHVRPGVDWSRVLGRPCPDPADGFRSWTRLEAAVKASGLGLSAAAGARLDHRFWPAADLTLPRPYDGYAAAVATDRAGRNNPVRIRLHSTSDLREPVTLP